MFRFKSNTESVSDEEIAAQIAVYEVLASAAYNSTVEKSKKSECFNQNWILAHRKHNFGV